MAVLLWIAVIAAYAWSVRTLARLCRAPDLHVAQSDDEAARPAAPRGRVVRPAALHWRVRRAHDVPLPDAAGATRAGR
jgi:hypothetical protein